MKIVEVIWDDAHVSVSEITKKEAEKVRAERTKTVAYLVAENDDGVVLATDTYEKEPSTGKIINFIPWDIIVSYEELVK